MTSSDQRYPIGRFDFASTATSAGRRAAIDAIAAAPAGLRAAVAGLTPEQLDTPYRDGGWTVRQVLHHVPDSHMNGYVRFKLALTEEQPTIKPYQEAAWAELSDVRDVPVETSLALLDALHHTWVGLMRGIPDADFERLGYVHPEQGKVITLANALAIYSWHGKHHAAHITSLRQRMGW